MSRSDGTTILNIGKSRSGKSSMIKALEKMHKRALAYDPKTEWCQLGYELYEDRDAFLKRIMDAPGEIKAAFASYDKKDFDFWAACAFNFNRQKEALLIAEELGAVAETGRALKHWGRLVNQGLGFGMTLAATVQRGQEVDKTIINNATAINIFQHSTETDAASMAERIGVDVSEIPRNPMEFIVWTPTKGVIIKRGKVEYKDGEPTFIGVKAGGSRPVKLSLQKDGKFKGVHYL